MSCADCLCDRLFPTPDMGSLGDQIGNAGDTLARPRQMRTAPLWGNQFQKLLLLDGRCNQSTTDARVRCAVAAHDGQGLASRNAFNALSAPDQTTLVGFVQALRRTRRSGART